MGIPVGMIVGGSPEDGTDDAWTQEALQRVQMLADNPALRPDQIIVQSWQPLPTHYLPESEPGTTMWLLLQAERVMH